jgi:hypothetical protein
MTCDKRFGEGCRDMVLTGYGDAHQCDRTSNHKGVHHCGCGALSEYQGLKADPEVGVLADAARWAKDATDRAHAIQEEHPQDAALMARTAFYLDWILEAYKLAKTNPDAARLDWLETTKGEVSFQSDMHDGLGSGWQAYTNEGQPLGDSPTFHKTIREAIDAARADIPSTRELAGGTR